MNELKSVCQFQSANKRNIFHTSCICTPECQEGSPPCFLCTQSEVQYMLVTDSTDDKYMVMLHQNTSKEAAGELKYTITHCSERCNYMYLQHVMYLFNYHCLLL